MIERERAGSYAFGHFQQNEQELERLKAQAGAAQALEQGILAGCGLKPGMRVLDLACGPGVISCLLARLVAQGEVVGIDLSADLLVEARAAAAEKGLANLSFQQGDVYQLDLPDQSFDFVYARFLFQHLQHPERALGEALRVLRPGGVMAIADVDDDWLTLHPEPEHLAEFTRRAAQVQQLRGGDRMIGRKLPGMLASTGFAPVSARVYTLTSGDLGMRGLLDLTTGFKFQQLAAEDQQRATEQRANIYGLLDQPNAWGFVGVFVASGRKPGSAAF